jgi:hypothetical protein
VTDCQTTFLPGDRVIVCSFGIHPGEVLPMDNQHAGWVSVRLDERGLGSRIWRGHAGHLKAESKPATADGRA